MNRLRVMPVLFCLSAAAFAAQATVPSNQPATEKIVTVSFNAAVLQTAEAQKDLNALKIRLAPRQAQLQALNDEVESSRKELGTNSNKLSDAERETRERSLEQKEKQLQRQVEDFRNDSQNESQQVFQKVAQKLYAFLQTYSQQHGYSLLIDRGSDAAPVVWYAAGNLDITDQVIKAYDDQPKGLPESPHLHP